MRNIISLFTTTLLISGCGSKDGSGPTESPAHDPSGALHVATTADLPSCDAESEGRVVYVSADKRLRGCAAGDWLELELAKGEKGEAGAPGTAGLAVAKVTQLPNHPDDFCTEFVGESCRFIGGQVINFTDGSLLITGGWLFVYANNGDSDTDYAAATIFVEPKSSGSWQLLHHVVARGTGFRGAVLAYDRASNKLAIIHDSNNNKEPDAADEVLGVLPI